MNNEECIICGAPLEYLNKPIEMECAICHRKFTNLMTSRSLARIAETGGPRCCKRDSYNAILAAINFVKEKFDIKLERPTRLLCSRSAMNNQCLKSKCPFHQPVFTIPAL